MKKLIFLLLLFPLVLKGQDLLVKSNGDSLNCMIKSEDSLNVYFTLVRDKKILDTYLSKKNIIVFVKDYYTFQGGGSLHYGDTLFDFDCNAYRTIKIGKQTWMAENLRTTHYADGTPLADGTNAGDISTDYTTRYCFVYNNDTGSINPYGRLYTWAAVMNGEQGSNANPSGVQGVCPSEWHVPSDSEWKELEMFLGMKKKVDKRMVHRGGIAVSGKMKSRGVSYWEPPNRGSTNECGFAAMPGGYRCSKGYFYNMGRYAYFWTATEDNTTGEGSMAWNRALGALYPGIYRGFDSKSRARSVRCIKD